MQSQTHNSPGDKNNRGVKTENEMSFHGRSLDEQEAANIVAGLHASTALVSATSTAAAGTKKRSCDNGNAAVANSKRPKKKPSTAAATAVSLSSARGKGAKVTKATKAKKKDPPLDATGLVFAQPELKPSPYFYYTDHSLELDDDPLTPMTAAGSVPTFPAKMHAILTNPQLADVVGWAPHGRSWRILKPRDFEIRVLPKYFEHSKFSSFVRQANGWGFRKMSHGYDKNAYYHEYFLRAMPWLCKKMRRPKVSEKKAVDPDMEPDLDAISAQLPVLDAPPTAEVLVLQKTIELGPKARMPVMWDTGTPTAAPPPPVVVPQAPPAVENNLPSLDHSPGYGNLKPAALSNHTSMAATVPLGNDTIHMLNMGNNVQNMMHRGLSYDDLKPAARPNPPSMATPAPWGAGPVAPIAILNMQNNVHNNILPQNSMPAPSNPNNFNTAFNYPVATAAPPINTPSRTDASDSHFAAGFMAASAYHSNHIRNMLNTAFVAGVPIPDNRNVVMPSAAAATASTIDLGSAFDLLQRLGIDRSNSHSQGNHGAAAAAGANSMPNGSSDSTMSQPVTLSEQVSQRLQNFQESSSKFD